MRVSSAPSVQSASTHSFARLTAAAWPSSLGRSKSTSSLQSEEGDPATSHRRPGAGARSGARRAWSPRPRGTRSPPASCRDVAPTRSPRCLRAARQPSAFRRERERGAQPLCPWSCSGGFPSGPLPTNCQAVTVASPPVASIVDAGVPRERLRLERVAGHLGVRPGPGARSARTRPGSRTRSPCRPGSTRAR